MKRRDFLKCSLAVGAGLAASPSTYAFNGESKEIGNDSSKLSKARSEEHTSELQSRE